VTGSGWRLRGDADQGVRLSPIRRFRGDVGGDRSRQRFEGQAALPGALHESAEEEGQPVEGREQLQAAEAEGGAGQPQGSVDGGGELMCGAVAVPVGDGDGERVGAVGGDDGQVDRLAGKG
jgi:hypothetical protein